MTAWWIRTDVRGSVSIDDAAISYCIPVASVNNELKWVRKEALVSSCEVRFCKDRQSVSRFELGSYGKQRLPGRVAAILYEHPSSSHCDARSIWTLLSIQLRKQGRHVGDAVEHHGLSSQRVQNTWSGPPSTSAMLRHTLLYLQQGNKALADRTRACVPAVTTLVRPLAFV
jgi:hypothetical protein